jgi:hypothetical protein
MLGGTACGCQLLVADQTAPVQQQPAAQSASSCTADTQLARPLVHQRGPTSASAPSRCSTPLARSPINRGCQRICRVAQGVGSAPVRLSAGAPAWPAAQRKASTAACCPYTRDSWVRIERSVGKVPMMYSPEISLASGGQPAAGLVWRTGGSTRRWGALDSHSSPRASGPHKAYILLPAHEKAPQSEQPQ